ncbi:MAG TPA: glycosyltransferase [Ktedonobacteraceae bacterium]|nr:glycosyltransferase [Ktedonobacteraceae bacterium]
MDRPTRIAFLSEHASPTAILGGADAGGQNVYVDEVSRNLACRGYTVDVFTRRDSIETPEIIEWGPGVRVIHLKAGPLQPRPKDELWPFMPEFRDSFLEFMQRDEVHYDLLHGNFWMSGWVAVELRRRLGIPAIQIFHAMGKTKRRHQKKVDTSPGDRIKTEMEVIRQVDRLIAQCPNERAELVDDYKADPGKVVVIPSAVNTRVFKPVPREEARRRIGLSEEDNVIVYVGRMLPRKDIRNIVRALAVLLKQDTGSTNASCWPITFLVVGGETEEPDPVATPEIGELQQLAAELGVTDFVRFVGKRQPNELRYYYSAGDVTITTPWYEPFGLTPLESMACGRPVIGSAVGGLTFTIKDGETGFLVPPRNPQALAGRLHDLLTQPGLCEQMGRAARARVEHEFTWPIVAMRTAALYDAVLAERQPETLLVESLQSGWPHADALNLVPTSHPGSKPSMLDDAFPGGRDLGAS